MGRRKKRPQKKKKKSRSTNVLSIDKFWPSNETEDVKKTDNKEEVDDSFIEVASFDGERKGYIFKKGEKGVGYYRDTPVVPEPDKSDKSDKSDEANKSETSPEETKRIQDLNMKLRLLIRKYDIREKNLQKAHRLWVEAIKLPSCKEVPDPCQWILGHEHFVKYWEHLKSQANSYKSPSKDAPLPEQVALILNQDSPLRRYMEYVYAYFAD